jgi:hypothetical protein
MQHALFSATAGLLRRLRFLAITVKQSSPSLSRHCEWQRSNPAYFLFDGVCFLQPFLAQQRTSSLMKYAFFAGLLA